MHRRYMPKPAEFTELGILHTLEGRGHDCRRHDHRRAALDQEQAEGPRPGDAPDQKRQPVMEWMPLLTASRCAKLVMFSHPTTERASMEKVSIIGLDLAKRSFQAHGARADGGVGFRKKLSREKVLGFFAEQPRCVVAMEACETRTTGGGPSVTSGMRFD